MGGEEAPEGGHSESPEASSRRPRHGRRRWIAVFLALGISVVLLVAAFELPVTTDFSLSVRSQGLTASVQYRTFPTGAAVTFHWNTTSGRTVTFSLLGSGGQVLSMSSADSGNLSFTADAGPYGFQSYSWLPEVVTVSGNYASPVLR